MMPRRPTPPPCPQLHKIIDRPDPRQVELEFQTTSRAAHPSLFGLDNRGGGGRSGADSVGSTPLPSPHPGGGDAAFARALDGDGLAAADAARRHDGGALSSAASAGTRPSLDLPDGGGGGYHTSAAAAAAAAAGGAGAPDSPDAAAAAFHSQHSPLQTQLSGDGSTHGGGAGAHGAHGAGAPGHAGHGRWRAYLHRAASFSSSLAAVGGGGERHQRLVRDEWGELRAVHVDTFVLTFRWAAEGRQQQQTLNLLERAARGRTRERRAGLRVRGGCTKGSGPALPSRPAAVGTCGSLPDEPAAPACFPPSRAAATRRCAPSRWRTCGRRRPTWTRRCRCSRPGSPSAAASRCLT
jgi:hypothetical protein